MTLDEYIFWQTLGLPDDEAERIAAELRHQYARAVHAHLRLALLDRLVANLERAESDLAHATTRTRGLVAALEKHCDG